MADRIEYVDTDARIAEDGDRLIRIVKTIETEEIIDLKSLREQIGILTSSIDAMQSQRAELREKRREIAEALNIEVKDD